MSPSLPTCHYIGRSGSKVWITQYFSVAIEKGPRLPPNLAHPNYSIILLLQVGHYIAVESGFETCMPTTTFGTASSAEVLYSTAHWFASSWSEIQALSRPACMPPGPRWQVHANRCMTLVFRLEFLSLPFHLIFHSLFHYESSWRHYESAAQPRLHPGPQSDSAILSNNDVLQKLLTEWALLLLNADYASFELQV